MIVRVRLMVAARTNSRRVKFFDLVLMHKLLLVKAVVDIGNKAHLSILCKVNLTSPNALLLKTLDRNQNE